MKFFFVALLALALAACNQNKNFNQRSTTSKTNQHAASTVKYVCPMHPDVVASKPGRCPKCGMELIKK